MTAANSAAERPRDREGSPATASSYSSTAAWSRYKSKWHVRAETLPSQYRRPTAPASPSSNRQAFEKRLALEQEMTIGSHTASVESAGSKPSTMDHGRSAFRRRSPPKLPFRYRDELS